jgi:histone-lysine N-methyltransferase SETD3
MQPGARLIELPRSCQLTYDESSDARVLSLIQQVPDELWGAKLALQVKRIARHAYCKGMQHSALLT